MNKMIKKIIFLFTILLVFIFWKTRESTLKTIEAFYFWENNRGSLSEFELKKLKELDTKKMYVKLFEVEKNEENEIIPTAKSQLKLTKNEILSIEIIPTIYIRNNVFKNSSKKELIELSENLHYLILKRYRDNFKLSIPTLKEIQIDCDWTESTKGNYFIFLKNLNKIATQQISATLRLYAYKFPNKMGILPVDRAMLMCYNLLSPIESGNRNSILELEELEKYLIGSKEYPLPLDVAIPIYSSIHIYQNNKFKGILYGQTNDFIKKTRTLKGLWHTIKCDTLINEIYIRKGDKIKYENNSPNKIKKAIDIIKSNVIFDEQSTIALYHLQEIELKQYTHEELVSFYTFFKH